MTTNVEDIRDLDEKTEIAVDDWIPLQADVGGEPLKFPGIKLSSESARIFYASKSRAPDAGQRIYSTIQQALDAAGAIASVDAWAFVMVEPNPSPWWTEVLTIPQAVHLMPMGFAATALNPNQWPNIMLNTAIGTDPVMTVNGGIVSGITLFPVGNPTIDDYVFVKTTGDASFTNCMFNMSGVIAPNNSARMRTVQADSGVLILEHCNIRTRGGGNQICVNQEGNAGIILNNCSIGISTGSNVGNVAVKNNGAQQLKVTNCVIGEMPESLFDIDLENASSGLFVVSNTPYKTTSGTITHIDLASDTVPGLVTLDQLGGNPANVWTVGSAGCDYDDLNTAITEIDALPNPPEPYARKVIQLSGEQYDVDPFVLTSHILITGPAQTGKGMGLDSPVLNFAARSGDLVTMRTDNGNYGAAIANVHLFVAGGTLTGDLRFVNFSDGFNAALIGVKMAATSLNMAGFSIVGIHNGNGSPWTLFANDVSFHFEANSNGLLTAALQTANSGRIRAHNCWAFSNAAGEKTFFDAGATGSSSEVINSVAGLTTLLFDNGIKATSGQTVFLWNSNIQSVNGDSGDVVNQDLASTDIAGKVTKPQHYRTYGDAGCDYNIADYTLQEALDDFAAAVTPPAFGGNVLHWVGGGYLTVTAPLTIPAGIKLKGELIAGNDNFETLSLLYFASHPSGPAVILAGGGSAQRGAIEDCVINTTGSASGDIIGIRADGSTFINNVTVHMQNTAGTFNVAGIQANGAVLTAENCRVSLGISGGGDVFAFDTVTGSLKLLNCTAGFNTTPGNTGARRCVNLTHTSGLSIITNLTAVINNGFLEDIANANVNHAVQVNNSPSLQNFSGAGETSIDLRDLASDTVPGLVTLDQVGSPATFFATYGEGCDYSGDFQAAIDQFDADTPSVPLMSAKVLQIRGVARIDITGNIVIPSGMIVQGQNIGSGTAVEQGTVFRFASLASGAAFTLNGGGTNHRGGLADVMMMIQGTPTADIVGVQSEGSTFVKNVSMNFQGAKGALNCAGFFANSGTLTVKDSYVAFSNTNGADLTAFKAAAGANIRIRNSTGTLEFQGAPGHSGTARCIHTQDSAGSSNIDQHVFRTGSKAWDVDLENDNAGHVVAVSNSPAIEILAGAGQGSIELRDLATETKAGTIYLPQIADGAYQADGGAGVPVTIAVADTWQEITEGTWAALGTPENLRLDPANLNRMQIWFGGGKVSTLRGTYLARAGVDMPSSNLTVLMAAGVNGVVYEDSSAILQTAGNHTAGLIIPVTIAALVNQLIDTDALSVFIRASSTTTITLYNLLQELQVLERGNT